MIENMRRLHPRGAANRGVCVDAEGAMLGPDCILVRRTPHGFRALERGHAAALQRCVFDLARDDDWLFRQTQRVTDALDRGEIALAQIYGLYIPVSDLDDRQLKRIATISALCKASYDPDEPRLPQGDPHGGEWTTGDPSTVGTSPDASDLSDSVTPATTDGPATPGLYAMTTDDGSSPAPAANADNNSPSSAKPPMTFEQAPPVPAPPEPAPPPLPSGNDHDTGPTTLGSDDIGDSPPVGSVTTEQPGQSDDAAPDDSLPELGQAPPPDIPEDRPDTTRETTQSCAPLPLGSGAH
jgi:hypothetical protein